MREQCDSIENRCYANVMPINISRFTYEHSENAHIGTRIKFPNARFGARVRSCGEANVYAHKYTLN